MSPLPKFLARLDRHPQKNNSIRRRLMLESLESRDLLAVMDLTSGVADGDSGSLRDAISIANRNEEDDVIHLAAGIYELKITGDDDDSNQFGDLDFIEKDRSITIRGAGEETTFIDAASLDDRVLHILSDVTVVLVGVTIRGGSGVE